MIKKNTNNNYKEIVIEGLLCLKCSFRRDHRIDMNLLGENTI